VAGIKMEKGKDITLEQVYIILGKSKRTITRYIKKGLLNPEKVKSKKETYEYID